MMDWILNIYDQTEHLLIIASIIAFVLAVLWTWRFINFEEWQDFGLKLTVVLGVWIIAMFIVLISGAYLKHKSEERREAQVEQPLVK